MAEFSDVMRQWRRMCNANCDDNNGCHEDCPLIQYNLNGCGAIYEGDFADHSDWTYIEKLVCEWAEKNPEPQYPTWGEFLQMTYHNRNYAAIFITPIPADIAEKLGIEPKEGWHHGQKSKAD